MRPRCGHKGNEMKCKFIFLLMFALIIMPLALVSAQDDTIRIRNIGNVSTFNDLYITDGASNGSCSLGMADANRC